MRAGCWCAIGSDPSRREPDSGAGVARRDARRAAEQALVSEQRFRSRLSSADWYWEWTQIALHLLPRGRQRQDRAAAGCDDRQDPA
jgi:hypothetical protein